MIHRYAFIYLFNNHINTHLLWIGSYLIDNDGAIVKDK